MRAFFKKLRTAVFFRKLLVSYLLILVLLTGILLFLSSSLIGTISNYSRQLAYKEAISYQSSLESNLDALDSLARELSGDQAIQTFLACNGDIPPQLHYDLPSIIEKLNSYKFLSIYINTIFIYLPQQELLITDSSVYSIQIWNQYHLNDDRFISLLDEFHAGSRISLNGTGRYASDIAILYTLPYGSSGNGMGTLAFVVDPMLVSPYRDASDLPTSSEVFTVDDSGNILFSSISSQELVEQYGLDPGSLTPGLHTLGDYTLYAVSSANIRFCMLLLYPLWTSRAHCLTVRRLPSSVSLSYCSADFCSASIWQIITTVRFLPLPARYLPAQRRKNLLCSA